jgi:hypothetical protein
MTATVNSRAAIQARIAEWQRQARNNDRTQTDLLFAQAGARSAQVRWFRQA